MLGKRIKQGLAMIGLSGLLSIHLVVFPSFAETAQESDTPPRQGLPGRRIGGGTRAPELSSYNSHKPLIALMPDSNLGITTEAYPTLLFHVPVLNSEQEVEFILYNSDDELIYDGRFSVTGVSGIVGFALSSVENLPPLAVNDTYKWYFLIVADDRSQDIVVDGWLQRVELDELAQSDSLAPLEEASTLYALRQHNETDENTFSEWNTLLNSIGFSHLSEESVSTVSFIPIENE